MPRRPLYPTPCVGDRYGTWEIVELNTPKQCSPGRVWHRAVCDCGKSRFISSAHWARRYQISDKGCRICRRGNKAHQWKGGHKTPGSEAWAKIRIQTSVSQSGGLPVQATIPEVMSAYEKSNGACEVCGSSKRICLDHDHKTGKLRGFLCNNCNHALGNVGDCPETLRGLAEYLERDHAR